jgi:flagellar basal body-associated protein FliL
MRRLVTRGNKKREVKKVKRIMLLIAATVLLMALSTTVVFAGSASPPNYGKVDPVGIWPSYMPPLSELTGVEKVFPSSPAPGGQIHIITDPLIVVGDDTDASGWVTFWCQ